MDTTHYKLPRIDNTELRWNVAFCKRIAQITKFPMTSSNENIFRVTGHLRGEFIGHRWIPTRGPQINNCPLPPTQRPLMRSFDVFFDLRLTKRLRKQWWGRWDTSANYDVTVMIYIYIERVFLIGRLQTTAEM